MLPSWNSLITGTIPLLIFKLSLSSQLPLLENRRDEPNTLSQLDSDVNSLDASNQINAVSFR